MEITPLKEKNNLQINSSVSKYYFQFRNFIDLIKDRPLHKSVIQSINRHIEKINAIEKDHKFLKRALRESLNELLKLLVKEHNLVTKNYYRNTWMVLGMAALGIPIGTSIGLLSRHMGLIAVGLPIGMLIGLLIGKKLDQKAALAGNQLDIEIKY